MTDAEEYARLRDRVGPLLEDLRRRAVENELAGRNPHASVELLRREGLTALRLPREHGGEGIGVETSFLFLRDLAAADPNVAQALRHHLHHVEVVRAQALSEGPEAAGPWLDRLAAGDVVGNATTEHVGPRGPERTTLRRDGDGVLRLSGRKAYSTGNLFAQWIAVLAVGEDGERVVVTIDAGREGVVLCDDWSGFGQRGTGSGTTVLTDVAVSADEVVRQDASAPLGSDFHQLVLLAVIAGVVRAAKEETVALVRERSRVYWTGNGVASRDDPQIQEKVGRLVSADHLAEALLARAARGLARAWAAREAGRGDAKEAADASAAEIYAAQVEIIPAALEATSALFDALGASATGRGLALDRHWRSVRTIASHNPVVYRARTLGALALNGTPFPEFDPATYIRSV